MLIKILDNKILEEHLEDLKRYTRSNTASKAVAIAASNFVANTDLIEEQSDIIADLQEQLLNIKTLLSNKASIQSEIDSFF